MSNDEFKKRYLKVILKDIGVETRDMDIELRGGATIDDLNKIITTQNPDAEEAPRFGDVGGLIKSSGINTYNKNTGIDTYNKNTTTNTNNRQFRGYDGYGDIESFEDEKDDPWMNFNNGGLVEGVKKMFSSSEDEIVKNPFEVENTNTPDFALLTAISALEGGDPQARVDVAQSIYNRVNEVKKDISDGSATDAVYDYTRKSFETDESGVFPEPTISDILLKDSQYQPAFIDPNKKEGPKTAVSDEFINVKDRKSAIVAMKSYYDKKKIPMSIKQIEELYDQTALDLQNEKMIKNAAKFVGGRTEFRGGTPKIDEMVFGTAIDRGDGSSLDTNNAFFIGKQKQRDGSFKTLGTGTQLESGASVSPLLKSSLESGASVSPLLKLSLESDLQSNILPMIESVTNKSTQNISVAPKSSQNSNIVMLPMPMGNTQPQPVIANDPVIVPVAPPEVTTTPVASTMSSVSFINMISNKQLSIG